ncbi:hypothetical protein ED28_11260 [[Pantoea] beijingensis]|uniref:Uncharacterized protein n=1 Tax=[Pantoea] beijingensis TaxID=1324864 RepID=A0A443ID45_9GAMM|nr:DUF3828 domain-containing protein [[Pantoea] beijingensis]RWR02201.1 hypothetical protein ED28_11260 [[Pantoea] beijingensis]
MIIKISHIKCFILFMFFILLSKTTFSTEIYSPEKVLGDFYYAYLSDNGNESELIDKYVLNNVIESVNDASFCNYDSAESVNSGGVKGKCSEKRECKASKGDYICNWDGVWVETDVNYFTKSQDVYPSWNKYINVVPVKGNKTDVCYLVSLGKYPDPVMKLKITLVAVEHGWKISKVTRY